MTSETGPPLDALVDRALAEARAARDVGEVPVGAVLWHEGRIVAAGHNRTVIDRDPTAHAEVVVLREAARVVGNHRLTGSVLVVTLEPCLQCCGAAILARVGRMVWAADDPRWGATATLEELMRAGRVNHRIALERGPAADEAGGLLRSFFRERRGTPEP